MFATQISCQLTHLSVPFAFLNGYTWKRSVLLVELPFILDSHHVALSSLSNYLIPWSHFITHKFLPVLRFGGFPIWEEACFVDMDLPALWHQSAFCPWLQVCFLSVSVVSKIYGLMYLAISLPLGKGRWQKQTVVSPPCPHRWALRTQGCLERLGWSGHLASCPEGFLSCNMLSNGCCNYLWVTWGVTSISRSHREGWMAARH